MTITRREILHRSYPRLHPACPQAACQRHDLVTQQTPVLQCTMTKVGKSDGEGTFPRASGNDEVAP